MSFSCCSKINILNTWQGEGDGGEVKEKNIYENSTFFNLLISQPAEREREGEVELERAAVLLQHRGNYAR